jgi:hypothetical protein
MAQKRIDYYGRFTPTGVDTSQAKRLQALSGLAEQVGDIAFEVGAKIQTKRGQEAGIASGMEAAKDSESPEAPELREGFLSQISIYDQAYNEAALNAYSSGVRVDGRKKLMELEEQFADEPDPEQFNKLWEGYIGGVTKGLPPEMAANLRLSLEDDGMRLGGRIADARRSLDFDKNVATISEELDLIEDDMARAARAGDDTLVETLRARMENRIQDNIKFVSPATAQKRRDSLEDRLVVQGALGQVDRAFLDDPDATLEQRIENGYGILSRITESELDISPEAKDSLEASVTTRINNLKTRYAEDKTALNVELNDYMTGITEGTYDYEQVKKQTDAWLSEEKINLSQSQSMRNKALAYQEEKSKTADIDLTIASQLDKDTRDPTVIIKQSDADDYFERMYAPRFESLPLDQRMRKSADFIQATRIVPKQVTAQVNTYLQSGNPELVIAAAQTIDAVDEVPAFFNQLTNTDTKIFAGQMVKLLDIMEPDEAYRQASQFIQRDRRDVVESRTKQIKDNKLPEKYSGWTEGVVGELNPIQQGMAESYYKSVFESFYLNGADEDAAKAQAEKFLSVNYRDSLFGAMLHPPENFYAVAGSVEYMRDDIASIIRTEKPDLKFDDEGIILIVDDNTQRTATKGEPEYKIVVQLEDDTLMPIAIGENEYYKPGALVNDQKQRVDQENQLMGEAKKAGRLGMQRQFEERFGDLYSNEPVIQSVIPES